MAACVGVFDTVSNTQDGIGFSVFVEVRAPAAALGADTLFFGNGPRRRCGEVKLPPGSMRTA